MGKRRKTGPFAVSPLFVAQSHPGRHQEVVDRAVGTRMAGRPRPDGAVDQLRVASGQCVVVKAQSIAEGWTKAMDQDVRTGEQSVESAPSVLGPEVEHDTAFGPVPGEEGGGAAGGIPAGPFHLHHIGPGLGQQ